MAARTVGSLAVAAFMVTTAAACGSSGDQGGTSRLSELAAAAAASRGPAAGSERTATTVVSAAATTTTATSSVPAPPPTTVPPSTQPVTLTVGHVIDGDTVDVTPSDGSPSFRVRLVGIDAPEAGACGADVAAAALDGLLLGRQIVLVPGGDGEDADKYGRLLRYVDVDGVDAGLALIEAGLAVARFDSRDGYGAHSREIGYVTADAASVDIACPPPTPPPPPAPTTAPAPPPAPLPALAPAAGGGCDPNYSGCVPIDSDVDCAGGSGNGPSYTGRVEVIGRDIYGLDRDGDGIGCE